LGSLWCGQQSIFFCAKFHSNVKNTLGHNPYKGFSFKDYLKKFANWCQK
jgi:hypothetical protein